MKKVIIIFLTLVTSGFLFSCNDELELPSDGRITLDQVFTDYNRTRGYLNSAYGYLPAPHIVRSSYSDEAQDANAVLPGSRFQAWYDGNVTAENFAAVSPDGQPWGRLYEGIRKCNVFLANIETADILASEEEKAGWIAQAHTLRALYYLQLIKRYGGVPIIDQPLGLNHDFSQDERATFSEVVTFILEDCNKALAAPDTREGFHWEVYPNQFEIMTRAVVYAIKSQAVTYAASPLWSDGTYTWADATEITAEALAKCLANGYELFNEEPTSGFAHNAYALYFITSSNDQRARDKETIYQGGDTMWIWRDAGLPTTPGMESAGPNPTQELIDSYEMANGEPPISGYADASHLDPIINSESGYDPTDPYEGRDPRFYASIYFNGAMRNLVALNDRDDTYSLDLTSNANQVDVIQIDTGYELTTTGGDPWIMITALTEGLNNPPSAVLTFEYKSSGYINPQIFFGPALAEARSIKPEIISPATEWSTYSIDITDAVSSFNWGNIGDNLRFDLGTSSGITMQIRNIAIEVKGSSTGNPNPDVELVETFVEGDEGISLTNPRHTSTGYYLRKFNYHKSGLNNNSDGAIRLFRLAGLYLNFAEAAYQSVGPDAVVTAGGLSMSARDAVNAVRERADMPPFPLGMSKEAFEEKYRNERRIELAFEGHRFFDVRRWKILGETGKFVTGMKILKSDDGGFIYNRFKFPDRQSATEKYLRYPIPQNEVDKIFGATGEDWQNPGW